MGRIIGVLAIMGISEKNITEASVAHLLSMVKIFCIKSLFDFTNEEWKGKIASLHSIYIADIPLCLFVFQICLIISICC